MAEDKNAKTEKAESGVSWSDLAAPAAGAAIGAAGGYVAAPLLGFKSPKHKAALAALLGLAGGAGGYAVGSTGPETVEDKKARLLQYLSERKLDAWGWYMSRPFAGWLAPAGAGLIAQGTAGRPWSRMLNQTEELTAARDAEKAAAQKLNAVKSVATWPRAKEVIAAQKKLRAAQASLKMAQGNETWLSRMARPMALTGTGGAGKAWRGALKALPFLVAAAGTGEGLRRGAAYVATPDELTASEPSKPSKPSK